MSAGKPWVAPAIRSGRIAATADEKFIVQRMTSRGRLVVVGRFASMDEAQEFAMKGDIVDVGKAEGK